MKWCFDSFISPSRSCTSSTFSYRQLYHHDARSRRSLPPPARRQRSSERKEKKAPRGRPVDRFARRRHRASGRIHTTQQTPLLEACTRENGDHPEKEKRERTQQYGTDQTKASAEDACSRPEGVGSVHRHAVLSRVAAAPRLALGPAHRSTRTCAPPAAGPAPRARHPSRVRAS